MLCLCVLCCVLCVCCVVVCGVWCVACGVGTTLYSGIEQSFKDGDWADESNYEVKGASTLSNVYKTEAPRKARENRALLVRRASCASPAVNFFCVIAADKHRSMSSILSHILSIGVMNNWLVN